MITATLTVNGNFSEHTFFGKNPDKEALDWAKAVMLVYSSATTSPAIKVTFQKPEKK